MLWLCVLYHLSYMLLHPVQFTAGDNIVTVDLEARKKKLSKDFIYLFNKLSVWQLSMIELADQYEDCFYNPLGLHLYGCSSVAELMKCKYINQVLEVTM